MWLFRTCAWCRVEDRRGISRKDLGRVTCAELLKANVWAEIYNTRHAAWPDAWEGLRKALCR